MSSSALSAAIAQAEGYGVPGAIPTLANNPGDLKLGDVGLGTINGITVFPNEDAGASALQAQVESILSGSSKNYSPDESIADVGDTYAGGDPNWAKNVAAALGVSTSTPIGQAASETPGTWQNALSNWVNGKIGYDPDNPGVLATFANITLEDGVLLVVGIIIVAAGLFSFKTTRTVIDFAAKKSAEVGAA